MKPTDRNMQVLIVDDQPANLRLLNMILSRQGYVIHESTDPASAQAILARQSIDVVITDLMMGEQSGLDLIRFVHQNYPGIESILLTAYGSIETAVEAIQAGAFDYITKPFSNSQLALKVKKAIERKSMKEELAVLRQHVAMSYGFDNIIGISKPMITLKETAMRIADTDITVLITGGSGTGKELFARAIHHHSRRRNGRFVAIDCSAIPEHLLESELFGHTKGSFTSAINHRKGLFEEADGGTIFLDEVANMPAAVQVKLLRFLQEPEIRPVGSSDSKRINTRVIAATNRDLGVMVQQGQFREDLYYRLNVIPLYLPNLIDRPEDIEILIEYFLRKISAEMNCESFTISRPAVEKLLGHHWPGNVRELENTLKRGAALATSKHLDVDDIMFIGNDSREIAPVGPSVQTLTIKRGLLGDSQRTLILKALDTNKWNFTRTAQDLGIGRTTLWRKIKKYDLRPETGELIEQD